MLDPFRSLDIAGGPVLVAVSALAAAALIAIVVRRFTARRMLALGLAAATGALLGWAAGAVADLVAPLGDGPPPAVGIWCCATVAAIAVAIADLLSPGRLPGSRSRARAWARAGARVVGTVLAVALFATTGVLAANAAYGLNHTVGQLIANPFQKPQTTLARTGETPAPAHPITSLLDDAPLWSRWTAPAGMPLTGTTSSVVIPNTLSGFVSRPAGLYLPPAALVADPPPLPLVIMLMGQPGSPDPAATATILNRFAATHHGLAPIVLIPDQLGTPGVDPLCVDSATFGKVQTFLTRDVVDWARTHLHVLQDAAHWTIAGYSNGGECALALAAEYPTVWKNVIDVSGELYPGSEHPDRALAEGFAGDQSAYDAAKPLSILAAHRAEHGQYSGMTGIFTVGSDNTTYLPQARSAHDAARDAGWAVTYFEVPLGGHRMPALLGGLEEGYATLYPVLGLADPRVPGDPNPLPVPTALPTAAAASPSRSATPVPSPTPQLGRGTLPAH